VIKRRGAEQEEKEIKKRECGRREKGKREERQIMNRNRAKDRGKIMWWQVKG
jgi:hypothetical protein